MYYFTIHITPEAHCSFVSFETNYPQKNYQALINKVLKMFQPGKFSMTLFANEVRGETNILRLKLSINLFFNIFYFIPAIGGSRKLAHV